MNGLIRAFVVWTSQNRVFHFLYQQYYQLAVWCVGRYLCPPSYPCCLILRADRANSPFSPGLSDIDLSVVHLPHDARQQTQFLCAFWPRYWRLKAFFPVLGEVGIFDTLEFELYLQMGGGPTGTGKVNEIVVNRLPAPYALGLPILLNRSASASPLEGMRNSSVRYVRHILPRLYRWHHSSHGFEEAELNRLISKANQSLRYSASTCSVGGVVNRVGELLDAFTVNAASFAKGATRTQTSEPIDRLQKQVHAQFGPRVAQLGAELVFSDPTSDGALQVPFVVMADRYAPSLLGPLVALCAEMAQALCRPEDESETQLRKIFPVVYYPVLLTESLYAILPRLCPFECSIPAQIDGEFGHEVAIALSRQFATLYYQKNNWITLKAPSSRLALYSTLLSKLSVFQGYFSGGAQWKERPIVAPVTVEEGMERVADELEKIQAIVRSHRCPCPSEQRTELAQRVE